MDVLSNCRLDGDTTVPVVLLGAGDSETQAGPAAAFKGPVVEMMTFPEEG